MESKVGPDMTDVRVLVPGRVGAQSGLGPGPGWGPYGPIGPLWAHGALMGPYGPSWAHTGPILFKKILILI